MAWYQDFEGIPLEGKHTVYSFLFMLDNNIDKKNYTYETMCDKELTAKRRYGRYLKKLSAKTCDIIKEKELISLWKYVWENGELNDKETNLIYHHTGLHE
ncbi:MAG: hypothetical protein H8E12_17055 [Rhodobacteraceae bacterium]|nr:hypothetical protein [Paracoccaceae bacterium]